MSELTIFYSWQSDLPKDSNSNAIRCCIQEASASIEKENPDNQILIDEATRGKSGSPDIPSVIFDKIQNCDIYVADISIISSKRANKKTPNPNVLIELGFAIKSIGWDRIILLFNKYYGKVPDDLPFDISKHRVTPFSIKNKDDKNGYGQLKSDLIKNFKSIIDNNPTHSFGYETIPPETKKRQNDIETINNYLLGIHIPTIDNFISEMPFHFNSKIFYFYEDFNSRFDSNYFYLYDRKIKQRFIDFKKYFNNCLSFAQLYDYDNRTDNHVLIQFNDPQEESNYKILCNNIDKLKESFESLLTEIRENWVDVNVTKQSDIAYQLYLEYKEKISKIFNI